MKPETMLKGMTIVTAIFVCAAVVSAAVTLSNRSALSVVWSEELAGAQAWSDNADSLRETLDALFPDKAREEDTASNEILPNFEALVNLNTAGSEELCTLPGIGEVLAARILEYREERGSFQTIEEIMEVSGVGEKTFEAIRELITV